MKYFNELLSQLPVPVQTQILKFRKWEDQQRSLLGKILLIKGLEALNLASLSLQDLRYTKYLKPYFDDSIDFNISHSGGCVVCAICETSKVGIDVEKVQDIPLDGFESQFSKNEWKTILQTQNPLRSFYTFWTQKEAFTKAIDSGLHIPLNEVCIKDNVISWNNAEWFSHELKLGHGYISHLSTKLSSPELVLHKVNFQ